MRTGRTTQRGLQGEAMDRPTYVVLIWLGCQLGPPKRTIVRVLLPSGRGQGCRSGQGASCGSTLLVPALSCPGGTGTGAGTEARTRRFCGRGSDRHGRQARQHFMCVSSHATGEATPLQMNRESLGEACSGWRHAPTYQVAPGSREAIRLTTWVLGTGSAAGAGLLSPRAVKILAGWLESRWIEGLESMVDRGHKRPDLHRDAPLL